MTSQLWWPMFLSLQHLMNHKCLGRKFTFTITNASSNNVFIVLTCRSKSDLLSQEGSVIYPQDIQDVSQRIKTWSVRKPATWLFPVLIHMNGLFVVVALNWACLWGVQSWDLDSVKEADEKQSQRYGNPDLCSAEISPYQLTFSSPDSIISHIILERRGTNIFLKLNLL